ncbi:hypothetical protein Droror1_Dr00018800 [Drosera rotundifolia]
MKDLRSNNRPRLMLLPQDLAFPALSYGRSRKKIGFRHEIGGLDRSGANWLDRFTVRDSEAGWSAGHDWAALEAAGQGGAGEARPKEGGSRESDVAAAVERRRRHGMCSRRRLGLWEGEEGKNNN